MGGFTSPTSKLVNTPAPGNLYPGIANQFQGMLGTLGPQAGQTLGEGMATGFPTDVGPAYSAMVAARKRGVDQGRQNLLESFGQMGLRNSSSAMTAEVDYEAQTQKDFAQILADFTRQSSESAAGRRMQAAGVGLEAFMQPAMTTYPTAALATGPSPMSTGASAFSGSLAMMLALGLL